ncbi:hypothetical protein [Kineococcus terrestris]|uniref:hypothetical protein n=1 Tax=Kineococcus terrestris TaxID=2044856 RepID=UPI0034DB1BFE
MQRSSRAVVAALVLVLACSCAPRPRPLDPRPSGPDAVAAPAGRVEFSVHDADGRLLDLAAVRDLQSAGTGEDGEDDLLLDGDDLTVVSAWPVEPGRTSFAVERPAGDVTLATAWPSASGYVALLLDLPAPGSYEFTTLIAQQALDDLDGQLSRRPGPVPTAVEREHQRARELRAAALAAPDAAREGALSARAFDAAVAAQVQLLGGPAAVPAPGRQVAVTFEDPSRHDALAGVRDLAGDGAREPWVRLVFDAARPASSYRADVAAARAAGVHVLGQFLDSTQSDAVDAAGWRRRVAEYVAALPGVQAWEVGNEVNGGWVVPDAAERAVWAARYVKENSTARTVLTLYWQLGEDDPADSLFQWAADHLPAADLADVDDLALSVYPEEHPLGPAVDRVLRTLHRAYPDQRLLVGELGYGGPDLEPRWWWGSRDAAAGKVETARWYSAVAASHPLTGGGTYWWYYLDDALPPSPVWAALAGRVPGAVARRARPRLGNL